MTAWPDKMITQAEAFAKAADWPVAAVVVHVPGAESSASPGSVEVQLWCMHGSADKVCQQSMGQLRRNQVVYNGSLDEMLSMVLRHMVMAHDVALNTRPKLQDNGPSDGSTP